MRCDSGAGVIEALVGLVHDLVGPVESALDIAHRRAQQPPRLGIERATARAELLAQPGEQLPQALFGHLRPPWSVLARRAERRTRRRRGRGGALAAEQLLPAVLASEPLTLFGELHTLGRERDHIRLAVHVDLALQLLVEFGSHCVLSRKRCTCCRW